jgi:AraC-like DNA-binding protein
VALVHVEKTLPGLLARGLESLSLGGGGRTAHFICGFLACDPQLSQVFLGGLPALLKVNIREDSSGYWLENSLRFSVGQAVAREAGASAMLAKLSEALFAETLRRYVRKLPEGQTGWFAGARDPGVGKALTLIHHDPAHDWTLAELAQQAGVSRTVLADRFRHFLGAPPMAYLTRWRLQLAARALAASDHSVARIALEVGYESEAAFSRAFKREYGLPPARYRADKSSAAAQ